MLSNMVERGRRSSVHTRELVLALLVASTTGCSGVSSGAESLGVVSQAVGTVGELDFKAVQMSPATSAPGRVRLAHLNADGRLDAVAEGADSGTTALEVYLGDGQGRLIPSRAYPLAGAAIHGLELADTNGDEEQDALALTRGASPNETALWVMPGDGTGSFGPAAAISLKGELGSTQGAPLALGDLNADGALDAVVALSDGPYFRNPSGTLAIMLGVGGSLGAPTYYPFTRAGSGSADLVQVGDFNGDDFADVVIAEAATTAPFQLLVGDGTGALPELRTHAVQGLAPIFLPPVPEALVQGDFTGDALLDLAIINDRTIFVAPGTGNGDVFGPIDTWSAPYIYFPNASASALDLNADGALDLIAVPIGSLVEPTATGTVLGLENDGAGVFREALRYDAGTQLHGATLGDLTGDGRADVVLSGSDGLVVMEADSAGGFVAASELPLPASAAFPGDFDGDGIIDVLVAQAGPPMTPALGAVLLRGVGGGVLSTETISTGNAVLLGEPSDFTGDGVADFLVQPLVPVIQGGLSICCVGADYADVWSSQGTSSFSPVLRLTPPPLPAAIGHVDRDNDELTPDWPDIVEVDDASVSLRRGSATGFSSPQVVFAFANPTPAGQSALADVTADGLTDLLVERAGSIALLRGDGGGGLVAAGALDAGVVLGGFTTGDLNRDGSLDVAASAIGPAGEGLVLIWEGTTSGTFQLAVPVSVAGGLARTVRAADVDGDTLVDLVLGEAVGYQDTTRLIVLPGRAGGGFRPAIKVGARLAGHPALADLDADGRSDLVVPNRWGALSLVFNSTSGHNTVLGGQPIRPIDPTRGTAPVSLTFTAIVGAGGMTTVVSDTFGQPPPFGYKLGEPPEYFQIATTAQAVGPIRLCIDFNPNVYLRPDDVQILHYDDGAWQALSLAPGAGPTVNPNVWRVCGVATSLSPFALMEPLPSNEPEELVLVAASDAVIREHEPHLNGGLNRSLAVDAQTRALVRFDLQGLDLQRVLSAELVLTVEHARQLRQDVQVDAHGLSTSWLEGNGRSDAGQRLGSGAGATWACAVDQSIGNRRRDCGKRWQGGVFESATAEGILHRRGVRGDVHWDVTEDVRRGLTQGWLIKLRRERGGAAVRYLSREGVSSDDPERAPRLIVRLLKIRRAP